MSSAYVERISLTGRVLKAGAWSVSTYAISQVIRFISNLIMTHLLMPKFFGIMGIATIIMVALAMFSDVGLRQNIIQSRRGDDPAFLNTAWTLQIWRGIMLWLAAVVIAVGLAIACGAGLVPAGSVYSDPNLPYVIIALTLSTVIGGFTTTKSAQASRHLALGRLTKIEIAAQIAGLASMLAWALRDRSVWALVAGALTSSTVSVALGHAWLLGSPNRLSWDKPAFHELVGFGKWIFISSILSFVAANTGRLFLGAITDSTEFGICVISILIVGIFDQVVSRLATSVSLPALSEVVRKGGNLRSAYYNIHAVITMFAYFASGFLFASGPLLVSLLYDARYAGAGWMLQILAVGLLASPLQMASQAYLALGMPQLLSTILAVRLAALAVAMPLGLHYFGIQGALWGMVASQFASLPIFFAWNIRNRFFDVYREVLMLPMVLIGGGVGKLLLIAVARQ
jgi:O-antigen/teichoic acid export membrane protein